jgi:hypothetical protein
MGHNVHEWAGKLGAMETGGPEEWGTMEMSGPGSTIRCDQDILSGTTGIHHPVQPGYIIWYDWHTSSSTTGIHHPVQINILFPRSM